MTNRTSERSGAFGLRGEKRSAIWRTMLFRYPGYGNSIPCVRTVATSAPRPPVGPPPAAGAVVGFAGCAVGGTGVALVGAGRADAGATLAGAVGEGGAV